MKILLDECVTKRLKPYLNEFEVSTVSEMKRDGIENNFDLILTIDKNLMFQQTLVKYSLSIVVLNSLTSKIEELILFMPSFKLQTKNLKNTRLTS